MIQLFPSRDRAVCEWCGSEHPQSALCTARPGLTRRSFLFLGAAAAVGVAFAPSAVPEGFRDIVVWPGSVIPKEIVAAQRTFNELETLIRREMYARIVIPREVIEASKHQPPGAAWVRAFISEREPGLNDLARTA